MKLPFIYCDIRVCALRHGPNYLIRCTQVETPYIRVSEIFPSSTRHLARNPFIEW
jgi:hypothetical protein